MIKLEFECKNCQSKITFTPDFGSANQNKARPTWVHNSSEDIQRYSIPQTLVIACKTCHQNHEVPLSYDVAFLDSDVIKV